MSNKHNTAEIDTANNVVDTTETPANWRQYNWEIYTRNPDTGEGGWDIKFRNVTATSKRRAYRLLDESELFDVAIIYNGSAPAPIEEERIWDTSETALAQGIYHTHPEALADDTEKEADAKQRTTDQASRSLADWLKKRLANDRPGDRDIRKELENLLKRLEGGEV